MRFLGRRHGRRGVWQNNFREQLSFVKSSDEIRAFLVAARNYFLCALSEWSRATMSAGINDVFLGVLIHLHIILANAPIPCGRCSEGDAKHQKMCKVALTVWTVP